MMNKYITVKYNNYSFIAPLHIKIDNIEVTVNCKIDTGCMKTNIPIKKLITGTTVMEEAKALSLKENAINNKVHYERSYGVSDNITIKKNDELLIKQGRLIECASLRFEQRADIIEISNFNIGSKIVGVNYDRTNNILIGMDIMKDWDIHIGKDNKTNEIIFLACPIEKINQDYLLALEEHFDLGTTISAAIVNDNIKNSRV